jgi:CRISPR-associated protein Csb1
MNDLTKLIAPDGPAGLAIVERLLPINADDKYIRPAIFAAAEGTKEAKERLGVFNITELGDSNVVTIDTWGSQANRIEPLFLRDPYRKLLPQITIRRQVSGETVEYNLLERPHRAADVIVRYSSLKPKFDEAMADWLKGDCRPLLKLAPTSVIFGFDDRRGTKTARQGRIVSSRIDATRVRQAAEYAQYTGVVAAAEDPAEQKQMSAVGWSGSPSYRPSGGVYVEGHIARYGSLSLSSLRELGPAGPDGEKARQYALGLAMVAFTAPTQYELRSGCSLRPDPKHVAAYTIATYDRGDLPLQVSHADALAFAQRAAKAFNVGPDLTGEFSDKDMRGNVENGKKKKGGK